MRQGIGKAQTDFEKRVAKEAAQQAGRTAVNAASIQLMSFFAGLGLTVFSVLGVINPINTFNPEQYLQCVYNMFFGIAVVICDGPPKLWNRCCNAQDFLFKYFFFLANPTGRAIFYFYVGTNVIFVLPENNLWRMIYFALGGTLMVIGLFMLFVRYCWDRVSPPKKGPHDGRLSDP